MNEHLNERFGRSRRGAARPTEQVEVWIMPPQLNENIRKYYDDAKKPIEGGSWLRLPEIPTASELLDIDTGNGSNSSSKVEIATNKPKGAWASKGEHLSTDSPPCRY